MQDPPPTEFSNVLAKEIYSKCKESILFLTFETRDQKLLESALVTLNPKIKELEKKKKIQQVGYATGFVVGETDETLEIVTCVRPMNHVYNASTVPSAEQLKDMFLITVLCDHQELTFRDNKRKDRILAEAIITRVHVQQGMLLLCVDKKELQDLQGETCMAAHRPLAPSKYNITALEGVLMVSWPPSMHRATAIGQISHGCRDYNDVFEKNKHGYTMKLLEVNITGIEEAVGAPLLDSQGGYIGMFHGKEEKKELCYFIAYPEIQDFTSGSASSQNILQSKAISEPKSPSVSTPQDKAPSSQSLKVLRKEKVRAKGEAICDI